MTTAVQIEKKSKTQKVGISLVQRAGITSGNIIIKELINQDLAGQGLKVGQRIVSINGSTCPPSAEKASIMIKETVGMLAIVAVDDSEGSSQVTRSFVKLGKKSKTQKVGISLVQRAGTTIIKELTNKDLVDQGLKVGQRIVSINGSTCPPSAEKASIMIKDTVGMLAIVAVDDSFQYPLATSTQRLYKVLYTIATWLCIFMAVCMLVRHTVSSPVRVGHIFLRHVGFARTRNCVTYHNIRIRISFFKSFRNSARSLLASFILRVLT